MSNPLFNMLGQAAMGGGNFNPMQMLSQLRSNPLGMLRQCGFNVPQNVSGPDMIVQYLLNSGQINQAQYDRARQMAQNFKF